MPGTVYSLASTISVHARTFLDDQRVRVVCRGAVAIVAAVVFGHTAVLPITEPLGAFYALLSGMAFGFACVWLYKGLVTERSDGSQRHEAETSPTITGD